MIGPTEAGLQAALDREQEDFYEYGDACSECEREMCRCCDRCPACDGCDTAESEAVHDSTY